MLTWIAESRRAPGVALPDLRIVASATLLLHEESDPHRVQRLVHGLTHDGVLRNPPIVAPVGGGSYVVLDGANRVTALTRLGYPDQLVQVVAYDDAAVGLEVWAHVLQADVTPPPHPAWRVMAAHDLLRGLEDGRLACGFVTKAGSRGLAAPADLPARVAAIARVVSAYARRTRVYRVPPANFATLQERYGSVGAVAVFPRFTKADIVAIARQPTKLPSGISRHIIPGRALRVNVDLALLRDARPASEKQALLEAMIDARLEEHRVRYYPESTVCFDE
jgi:hypothetical protein